MTKVIRCDMCGAIMKDDTPMRADFTFHVCNIPGGLADTPFGEIRKNHHYAKIEGDLCEGCLRELCGFLKMEVPE